MRNKKMKVIAGALAAATVLTAGTMTVAAEGRFSQYLQKLQDEAEYTKEEALDIAVEDAKLDEKDVKRSRVELDYDDGKLTYDVEFYTDSEEYDYEIDAKTGKILSADREIERDFRDIDPVAEAQYT